MKGKSLIAACLIVPLAAAALGVYLWADTARLDVERYGFLRPQAERLVVQFADQLVWLDRAGRERRTMDLAEHDIRPHGDFAFFPDGDLLIYHRAHSPGLLHNLARFFRLQRQSQTTSSADNGFYRCAVPAGPCRRFGQSLPMLETSFRLEIGPEGVVYLADTAAFTLYKVNANGRILAESQQGQFQFPNQLILRDGRLWVADTNQHRVVALATDTDDFAAEQAEFAVDEGGEHRWPHQIAPAPTGWWVNVGNNALADGRLVRFGTSGERLERLDSPVADPLAIAYWADDLWVADFERPELVRGGPAGFTSVSTPALERATARASALDDYYRRVSHIALGVLGAVLVLGFGAAWWLERDETLAVFKNMNPGAPDRSVTRPAKPVPEGKVFWLTNTASRTLKWMTVLALVLIALTLGSLLTLMQQGLTQTMPLLWAMGAFVVVVVGGSIWILRTAASLRLGVIGESIVMQQGNRGRTVARARDIRYTHTHLVADNVTIALGQPQHRFFDRKQLNDYIFPRLKEAERLGAWAMIRHLWQVRDPQFVAGVSIMLTLLALYGALKLSGG